MTKLYTEYTIVGKNDKTARLSGIGMYNVYMYIYIYIKSGIRYIGPYCIKGVVKLLNIQYREYNVHGTGD